MNGAELIAVERQRQIDVEGYDAAHDRGHAEECAQAGAAYALAERLRPLPGSLSQYVPNVWPWGAEYWKPTPNDRIRELVKAGALIAAAIDSLLTGASEPER